LAADPQRSGPDAATAGGPDTVGPHDFNALYAAHYTSLTTQLYAYFGDRHEAQDVVQEAFCRALARWRQLDRYDDPVAWVRRVAWNLATSNVRRLRIAAAFRHRHRPEHASAPDPGRVALFAALRTLPPRQRQAVVLHYVADRPLTEIAGSLGVSLNTCKSWLHRARTALARELATSATGSPHGTTEATDA
jgi:RNA polymerase sigma-70 factor (ECF subfamily)